MRTATIARSTAETAIAVTVNLDGTGQYDISTGIGFLDHMVEQFSRHSLIDVSLRVRGDLHVGEAHSPMDEALARVALDISGRPVLVWNATFTQPRLGEMDTELFEHWFASVAQAAGITLHIACLYGTNNHHVIEGIFKGFARAMRVAIAIDPRKGDAVPSTKGQLGG